MDCGKQKDFVILLSKRRRSRLPPRPALFLAMGRRGKSLMFAGMA
jgi:hypothetical protein